MSPFQQPPFWARSHAGVRERWAAVLVTPAVVIATSSIANPTLLTTTTPHGLVSGDTATIAGHTGSTPAVAGLVTVTVLTPLTFTVPVNVTVAGTGGTVTRTTPVPVVSLADAKLHARIGADVTAEDTLVASWTKAATQQVQNDTQHILRSEMFDLAGDAFPVSGRPIVLPFGPLASVVYVKSTDSAATVQTMTASDYVLDTVSRAGRIGLADAATWPTDLRDFQPASIRVVVGYASIAAIPEPLLQAVRLAIAWHSMNREPTAMEQGSYDWLVDPYRPVIVA